MNTSPIWPQTALGYAALAFGFLAAIHNERRAARAIWAIPLLIAALGLAQSATGISFGTDRLLFGDAVMHYSSQYPGRPGTSSCIILILLSLSGYATLLRHGMRDEVSSLLASLALALGIAAAALLFFSSTIEDPEIRRLRSSLPGSFAAVSLALAFIVWNVDFGWVRLITAGRTNWRTLRYFVPLLLLLPLVPSLFEILFVPAQQRSPLASQLIVVALNIIIVALIAYGAVIRVSRGQAAIAALAEAFDKAMVALVSPDGRIAHWSRGCEKLYGYTAEEAIGQYKYALLRSRCQQGSGLPRRTASDAQELVEIHRDGHEITVIEQVHRVESPGQEPMLVFSITDTSETAAAMAALHESEVRLAEAAAVQELGVFEWDVASGQFRWSPGTEQRLGVVPGSLPDFDSWRAQIHPDDLEDILDTVAQAVADRAERFRYRYRFLQPNGSVRAVEGSSRAFYDDEGNLVRTIGVLIDVSEREQREEALRGREAQLRSVLENVPDAMVVVGHNGVIEQFSAAAEALWGYRASEMTGRNFRMLAPLHERRTYAALIAESRKRRPGAVTLGFGEAADGRNFPVEIRTGIAHSEGRTLYTIFFRDISERLEAEARLVDLNAELAHVSRQGAMSELAADLAHELNQPLAAMANFLAASRMLTERGEEKDRVVEMLTMASEQTQRAGEIIRRMRDFTARGEVEMRAEPIERAIREAAGLVFVGAGRFGTRVIYEFDPEALMVQADRVQIQQVLVNLLRNALQALQAAGVAESEITISTHKLPDNIVAIEVADNGPGIPDQLLERLFARFATTKHDQGGMGIGLSISKRIIEAHGGTLSAENRPNGGAAFRFTLPAVEEGESI